VLLITPLFRFPELRGLRDEKNRAEVRTRCQRQMAGTTSVRTAWPLLCWSPSSRKQCGSTREEVSATCLSQIDHQPLTLDEVRKATLTRRGARAAVSGGWRGAARGVCSRNQSSRRSRTGPYHQESGWDGFCGWFQRVRGRAIGRGLKRSDLRPT